MTKAKRAVKGERIELRVTPGAKALLAAAADARHTTISNFLLTHGIAAAEQVVTMPKVFYASEEGWAAIHRMLEEDEKGVEPDPEVVARLARHKD